MVCEDCVAVALGLIAGLLRRGRCADPVIVAAGDIACDPHGSGLQRRCGDGRPLPPAGHLGSARRRSARRGAAARGHPVRQRDRLPGSTPSTTPTWGRVKSISRPILGNHESGSGDAAISTTSTARAWRMGRRALGARAITASTSAAWHLVALNSNCSQRRRARPAPSRSSWLRADLAAHPTSCTLAYWHHPRYSSGHDGSNTSMQPLWEALARRQAPRSSSSGHSHDYERFAPLDRERELDQAGGIRQFVVGTGGAFFTGGLGSLAPHSEVAQNDTFGVLLLTLHPASYDWRFVPEAGKTFTDAGSESCHGLIAPPLLPGPVPDGTAPVITKLRLAPRPIRRKSAFRYELVGGGEGQVHDQAQGRRVATGRSANSPSWLPRGQRAAVPRQDPGAAAAPRDLRGPPSGGRCSRQPLRTQDDRLPGCAEGALTSHFARTTFGTPEPAHQGG